MELEVGDSNVILDFLLLRLWMREGQLHSTIDETIRYWSAKGQSYIELLRYAEGVVVRSLDCFFGASVGEGRPTEPHVRKGVSKSSL